MEADSFSLKLTLSVFASHKNPIKCYHNNIHLMGLEKYNKIALAFNFKTRWSCAATGSTSC